MGGACPVPAQPDVIYSSAGTATGPPKRHPRGWRQLYITRRCARTLSRLSRRVLACSPRPKARHAPVPPVARSTPHASQGTSLRRKTGARRRGRDNVRLRRKQITMPRRHKGAPGQGPPSGGRELPSPRLVLFQGFFVGNCKCCPVVSLAPHKAAPMPGGQTPRVPSEDYSPHAAPGSRLSL